MCSVRGAFKRVELEATLASTGFPDVVCIQETWLCSDVSTTELPLGDYDVHRLDRDTGRRGGGVLIATKKELKVQSLPQLQIRPAELIWIEISGLARGHKVVLGNYYKPSSADVLSATAFASSLDLATTYATSTGAKVLVVGDFNTPDIVDWVNQEDRLLFPASIAVRQSLNENSLVQLVDLPTRGNNILDLVCTTHPDLVTGLEHVPLCSDHEGLHFKMLRHIITERRAPVPKFCWKRADWDGMVSYLLNFADEYDGCHHTRSVEENWHHMKSVFQASMEQHVPKVVRKFRKNALPREVLRLVRKRDRAYKTWKQFSTPQNRARYNSLRNRAKHECATVHRTRMNRIAESLLTSARPLFQHMKNMKNENQSPPDILVDGSRISDAKQKSNAFNQQFSSVFTAEPQYTYLPDLREPEQHMPLFVITEEGVLRRLEKLDVTKSGGPDGIPACFLKAVAPIIARSVACLYQQSLVTGDVPKDWRTASIHPIFKKGDKHKASNYRPVSLTSILCKQMEHIVVCQMNRYFAEHGLLYERQHGFRSGQSCETALASLIHHWAGELDPGFTVIDCLLLDFAKAFDTVPHRRLLHKVEHMGVHPVICQWISSFLSGRLQRVQIDGEFSDWLPVTSGIPQGSVIGPLLFSIFINDIHENLSRGTTLNLFADDAIVYRTVMGAGDCRILQKDLDTLAEWSRAWLLKFNVAKCANMRISTRSTHPVPRRDYSLLGETLPRSDSETYLGVKLSARFNFREHIHTVVMRCNSALGLLRRNLTNCSPVAKKLAFVAYVRSRLEYCATVFDPHTQELTKKLEAVQNRAVRFIIRDYRRTSSVTAMKARLGLDSLALRRKQLRHNLVQKFIDGSVKIPGVTIVQQHNNLHAYPAVTRRESRNTLVYRTLSERNHDGPFLLRGIAPHLPQPP